MEKRWMPKAVNHEVVKHLQEALRIHPALCRLLAQRGIYDYDAAKAFFRPSIQHLHDPWLMKDMEKAVGRILTAIERQEKILVYGDYDVDGTTAVAMVYSFFRDHYPFVEFYVPHRYREGYGLSMDGIRYALSSDVKLLITLDCGIKAVEKIAFAREQGIDVIVCDHHLPDHQLPPATAILNPKQDGCPYPYKELSGCGIGFKLISAYRERLGWPEEKVLPYLDLVATSIAADIVPINGENRVLTFLGLKRINESPLPGIKALIELSGLKKSLHVGDLVFIIAPRINAAGRMDDARKAIQLFIESDYEKALELAGQLHQDNSERKELDSSITEEALHMIAQDATLQKKCTTVLYQPHWHKGVVGIVASRLIESYYRPTIVLTQSNDKIAGSARSVAGFNIYEALHQCGSLLENYGGHFYAAGMTLKPENISIFQEKFEEVVARLIDPELLIPEIKIDAEIQLKDITHSFYNIIRQFEPFGPANMRPVFLSRSIQDTGYSRIVKENHIRFDIVQNGMHKITGIGFNLAHKFDIVSGKKSFDICYTLDENEWNGYKALQLKVIDLRPYEG